MIVVLSVWASLCLRGTVDTGKRVTPYVFKKPKRNKRQLEAAAKWSEPKLDAGAFSSEKMTGGRMAKEGHGEPPLGSTGTAWEVLRWHRGTVISDCLQWARGKEVAAHIQALPFSDWRTECSEGQWEMGRWGKLGFMLKFGSPPSAWGIPEEC